MGVLWMLWNEGRRPGTQTSTGVVVSRETKRRRKKRARLGLVMADRDSPIDLIMPDFPREQLAKLQHNKDCMQPSGIPSCKWKIGTAEMKKKMNLNDPG